MPSLGCKPLSWLLHNSPCNVNFRLCPLQEAKPAAKKAAPAAKAAAAKKVEESDDDDSDVSLGNVHQLAPVNFRSELSYYLVSYLVTCLFLFLPY